MKAKKLPSGNWRIQVFAGYKKDEKGNFILSPKTGKKIPGHESITAPSKDEVEYLAAQYKLDRAEHSNPTEYTVKQSMERYIADRVNILSPTTIQGYKKIVNKNLQALMSINGTFVSVNRVSIIYSIRGSIPLGGTRKRP